MFARESCWLHDSHDCCIVRVFFDDWVRRRRRHPVVVTDIIIYIFFSFFIDTTSSVCKMIYPAERRPAYVVDTLWLFYIFNCSDSLRCAYKPYSYSNKHLRPHAPAALLIITNARDLVPKGYRPWVTAQWPLYLSTTNCSLCNWHSDTVVVVVGSCLNCFPMKSYHSLLMIHKTLLKINFLFVVCQTKHFYCFSKKLHLHFDIIKYSACVTASGLCVHSLVHWMRSKLAIIFCSFISSYSN